RLAADHQVYEVLPHAREPQLCHGFVDRVSHLVVLGAGQSVRSASGGYSGVRHSGSVYSQEIASV
ncbi:hypothetical protein GGF48_005624, partial [Coemansia sp. RSA 921]